MANDYEKDCRDSLQKMIQLLGFSGEVMVETEEKGLVARVRTEETARLIGRRGRHLENLELLLNRVLKQQESTFPSVVLDIDGYRRKKRAGRKTGNDKEEQATRKMACDAAEEVKRWGEPKILGPYDNATRRLIHQTLSDDPEVTTVSCEGDSSAGEKNVEVRLKEDSDNAPDAEGSTR